ncbi:D-2-hydroxyacid dehydrogenase [Halomonas sp. PR-M31]|uniref:D-2-hydroxyacid dehydrogenase n=1 Tax=Halomonas sp. PR-M31 TaxID=1471202 RepID=UPI0006522BC6|nr:D-2-hydroxyacid dehydrogenase [Halomonas sp. PR-M31]
MIDFSRKLNILFMQKPEVLKQQRGQVEKYIKQNSSIDFKIYFASKTEDIVEGTNIDIIVTPTLDWLPSALEKVEGCQWIHFLSAGVEKIWKMDFDKENIILTKSSGVNSAPMSEYALGAMLYFAKQFDRFNEKGQDKTWEREWLEELTGKKLAILGLGHVGKAVAEKANAFGMKIVGVQRKPKARNGIDKIVPLEQVEEIIYDSDYIVVCLPLTDDTRQLVDEKFLNTVKPGCVLIDISRGGIVNEDSIINALDSKKLRGAALDVFEKQPLSSDSKLWQRSNVLITPHVSGTTPFYLERAIKIFSENLNELKKSGVLLTRVSVERRY